MIRYIPLYTAAIFFQTNFYLKHGIDKVYIMVDFISKDILALQGAEYKKYFY